jgi:hypothetical protein
LQVPVDADAKQLAKMIAKCTKLDVRGIYITPAHENPDYLQRDREFEGPEMIFRPRSFFWNSDGVNADFIVQYFDDLSDEEGNEEGNEEQGSEEEP